MQSRMSATRAQTRSCLLGLWHCHHFCRSSKPLAALQCHVEQLLMLMSRAFAHCCCEAELLLPLARVAAQTLPLEGASEGLALLQLQAAGERRRGRQRGHACACMLSQQAALVNA